MKYNPDYHHRQSIRLKGYDYRQAGAYYVTICCYQKICFLGEIINGIMKPNFAGETAAAVWYNLPRHFPFLELDAFVVMPNHFHGIIVINQHENNKNLGNIPPRQANTEPSLPQGTQSGSLGAIVQNFKSVTTRRVNRMYRRKGTIWQRDYHEEIIWNDRAYENIRRYIIENPLTWEHDKENPLKFTPIPGDL